jgi:hypothetical protein
MTLRYAYTALPFVAFLLSRLLLVPLSYARVAVKSGVEVRP